MRKRGVVPWIEKPAVFLLLLIPAIQIGLDIQAGRLGANPVEAISHRTGEWTLRILLLVLAVAPLRHLTGRAWVLRFRRMIGLFVFFYASLHFLTWLILDQGLLWEAIRDDIFKRPYIMVGFAAYAILIPLALTSTNRLMKKLGKGWWKLHRLVYLSAGLGVLHFLWLVKLDSSEPLVYGIILGCLLAFRAWRPGFSRDRMDAAR